MTTITPIAEQDFYPFIDPPTAIEFLLELGAENLSVDVEVDTEDMEGDEEGASLTIYRPDPETHTPLWIELRGDGTWRARTRLTIGAPTSDH